MELPTPVLVDRRNYEAVKEKILTEIRTMVMGGFDLETQDVNAHAGIKALRKEDDEGNKKKSKIVFDWRRMVITGFSIYPDGSDNRYYFNLNHADVENRLTWDECREFIDAKPSGASWICHNAPFEITVMSNTYNYMLMDVICTMQMAVSAYGPDEFDRSVYPYANLGGIPTLFAEVDELFKGKENKEVAPIEEGVDVEEVKTERFTPKQHELLQKVIGKQTDGQCSYNYLAHSLAYSYGLKKMVKVFFNYDMATFEDTLGAARHMGELTGDQVAGYGSDDAYWAVRLFYRLYDFMMDTNPAVVETFFTQENPMIYVFAEVRTDGVPVNVAAIEKRRDMERKRFADVVREMKLTIRDLLPFRPMLCEKLSKDKWYGEGNKKDPAPKGYVYRERLREWALSPNVDDDFAQACQVSSPVSNAWAGDKCDGISIGHYYQTRLLMYDLIQMPPIVYKGKISSDGECRGELRDKIKQLLSTLDENDTLELARLKRADRLLELMGEVATIEQRMKLYITPYLLLTDPETGRMYPELTSMLATRRMACANPNAQQLAKRGESTYVRGFYLADDENEVMVSLDWSQVELVEIGEFSGDPEFAKAYGQLPYQDLHLGTAADVLAVVIPEVTVEMMKNMHNMKASDLPPKLLVKPNGEALTPGQAKKFWRTEVGKGSNFNYWYSGALSTVGDKLGWKSSQMWEATERYRARFPVAEQWRVNTIDQARWDGKVTLPDHHTRVRYEATYEWINLTQRMFDAYQSPAVTRFGNEVVRAIKNRAGNQLINALIQGSSATLAKRSILRIRAALKANPDIRARFKMAIHDELVFSVHKDDVLAFISLAKTIMADHPDIIKNLKLYSTASIGLTFEPFHEKNAPIGQIELDEAPACLGFGDGVVMTNDQVTATIDYLFNKRTELRKAA